MSAGAIAEVDPTRPAGPVGLRELATRLALTPLGTWFYSQVAARIDLWLVRASRGRVSTVAGLLPISS
jgi:hypothetical protein